MDIGSSGKLAASVVKLKICSRRVVACGWEMVSVNNLHLQRFLRSGSALFLLLMFLNWCGNHLAIVLAWKKDWRVQGPNRFNTWRVKRCLLHVVFWAPFFGFGGHFFFSFAYLILLRLIAVSLGCCRVRPIHLQLWRQTTCRTTGLVDLVAGCFEVSECSLQIMSDRCVFKCPRITITFEPPHRASLVFTLGADEVGSKEPKRFVYFRRKPSLCSKPAGCSRAYAIAATRSSCQAEFKQIDIE